MAYTETEDDMGRQVKPLVANESEDGSGTWHVPVCDTSGYLKVAMQSVLDDVGVPFGTDSPAKIQWQTDDANANVLAIIFPEGSDPDVPVLVIGDATAEKDLGFFDGVTQPRIAVIDDDGDSWGGMGHTADDIFGFFTKNSIIRELDSSGVGVRNAADNAYNRIAASYIRVSDRISYDLVTNGRIDTRSTNTAKIDFYSYDTDAALVLIGTIQGAAEPWWGIGKDADVVKATYDDKLGFFSTTPISKPTLAADDVANVITELVNLGLINAAV